MPVNTVEDVQRQEQLLIEANDKIARLRCAADLPPENRAKISRKDPTWLPACETRGEGIFFQFSEKLIQEWVTKNHAYDREFEVGHQAWRASKNLEPNKGYPGIRYVLLHTFAHALIWQLAIECGYTSARSVTTTRSVSCTSSVPWPMGNGCSSRQRT